jgi:hypothetical protein
LACRLLRHNKQRQLDDCLGAANGRLGKGQGAAKADRLSQSCFQALTVRGLAYAGAFKACRLDYRRLCAGVPPGYGRGLQCLLGNAAGLSPQCRSALEGHELLGSDLDGPGWGK